MTYYIGDFNVEGILGVGVPRFFYGLRRTKDGELYPGRLDQLAADDVIEINQPGVPEDNYNDFEVGIDFFEGIDVNHDTVYKNLNYQQYRWGSWAWRFRDPDANLYCPSRNWRRFRSCWRTWRWWHRERHRS